MLLNNLRKVAKGKTNKAYASISKMPTLSKFSQKYLTPMFPILVQIQQKKVISKICVLLFQMNASTTEVTGISLSVLLRLVCSQL